MRAVSTALGREINQGEGKDIVERMRLAARKLAADDPAGWQAKSEAQRLIESAEEASKALVGEARRKAELESLQIAANSRMESFISDMAARGIGGLDAFDRSVAFHADGKANGLSIESQTDAIYKDLIRQLIPVMEASNPKWFGLFENREGVEAIIKELHGEDSGNPVAKAGAKIWHEVSGKARASFNAAGGDIGLLDDWGMPHHHSQMRVARAGREEWLQSLPYKARVIAKLRDTPPPKDWARNHWINEILPRLKRERYVKEDGRLMNDKEMREFLGEAWLTIATGGANKVEPGKFKGGGMRANRGNSSRSVHFKDAQNFIDYQKSFGEKSLYEVLMGHIEGISKDIALVKNFGPNADQTARYWLDRLTQEAKLANPALSGDAAKRRVKSENLYNYVAGRTQPVASQRLAEGFDTVRNWLTGGRLGAAIVSSMTDDVTLHLTGHMNNLPPMRLLANELAAFNPANKMEERMANRAGLALNTFISSLNRFGQDSLKTTFSRKMANTVMRVQGLNAATEARRRAFGVTMMGSIGSAVKEHTQLGKLDPKDQAILKSKGVTDEEFYIWKAAQLEDWGGGNDTMLTPDSIYRIPDEKLDKAIAASTNRLENLKQESKAKVGELQAKDVEDRGWVQTRAKKLSDWLAKEAANLTAKARTANAEARVEIGQAAQRLSKLQESVDAAAESWATPPDANTPGTSNRETVGFYGKGKLRVKGVDEGRALEQMRQVRAEVSAIKREAGASKTAEVNALRQKFDDRKAELDEFTAESDKRVARRQKVADRINRDLNPAIERMRTDARENAVMRLLGTVLEETNMAVIEPGARERAFMHGGFQRGTWKGEIARSFWLFKSFPLAMITRHLARGMAQKGWGRAGYIAALMASTTVLGAMAMQVKEMLAGRDPRNLNPMGDHGLKNWLKAFLQGGSLGIYGDFLFSESTQHGQSPVASFLGPVVGLGEDIFKLTQGNLVQAAQGKDTDFGAELLKLVQGITPGGNLWYTKAVIDHFFMHRLQEYLSPGYLARMKRRSEREFGNRYWWEPGEVTPDRAPDPASAVQD